MKARKSYIDFAKIIAIFMVLFNHTGTKGFFLFSCRLESPFYPVYLFIAVFIKIAVPMFFMASGALLLDKEESIADILRKRFVKYLLCLILFSGIVYIYKTVYVETVDLSLLSFVKRLYSGTIASPFWFLYSYLAYVLMLPFLRKLAKSMSMNDFRWMLLMCAAIQSIPMLEYALFKGNIKIRGNFNFFITTNYLLYPIMGYFIDKTSKDDIRISKFKMACIGFITLLITCYMTHYKCMVTGIWNEESAQTFFNNLIFIPAGVIFYFLKIYFECYRWNNRVNHILALFGGLTFGIYVLEYIYRGITEPVFYCLEPYLGSLFASVVWIATSCVVGGIVTWVLKHIPAIKEII